MKGRTISISFSGLASIGRREDGRWRAYMEPFGVTVYGDTEEEARDRLVEAVDFFQSVCQDSDDPLARMASYFDSHAVDYSVSFSEGPSMTPFTPREHAVAGPKATVFRGEALVYA